MKLKNNGHLEYPLFFCILLLQTIKQYEKDRTDKKGERAYQSDCL